METDARNAAVRVTIDEIGPDQDNVLLASLVTDGAELITVPLHLLPDGARVGDVLLLTFQQEPDEREQRRRHIADLQRRLFGSG